MKIYSLITLLLLLMMMGCGDFESFRSNQEETPNVLLVLPEKAISPSLTLKAYAVLDDTDNYDLSIYSSYVGGTITGVSGGSHKIVIHIQGRKESTDNWVDIITVSKDVAVSGTDATPLNASESDLVYPDSDGDGILNLNEIANGTNPNNGDPLGTINMGNMTLDNYSTCGNVQSTLLPNPFGTNNVTVSLTNVYNVSGYVFTTGLSKWQIADTSNNLLFEQDYSFDSTDFTFGDMTCHCNQPDGIRGELFGLTTPDEKFKMSDGLLDGRSFTMHCLKNGNECHLAYCGNNGC